MYHWMTKRVCRINEITTIKKSKQNKICHKKMLIEKNKKQNKLGKREYTQKRRSNKKEKLTRTKKINKLIKKKKKKKKKKKNQKNLVRTKILKTARLSQKIEWQFLNKHGKRAMENTREK